MGMRHPNFLAERLAGDLYGKLLNRNADRSGYAYVLDSLREGKKSVRQHAVEMVCSQEFANRYLGGLDAGGVVTVLNKLLLGRILEMSELGYEVEAYRRIGREQYTEMLTRSNEYQRRFGDDRVPGGGY